MLEREKKNNSIFWSFNSVCLRATIFFLLRVLHLLCFPRVVCFISLLFFREKRTRVSTCGGYTRWRLGFLESIRRGGNLNYIYQMDRKIPQQVKIRAKFPMVFWAGLFGFGFDNIELELLWNYSDNIHKHRSSPSLNSIIFTTSSNIFNPFILFKKGFKQKSSAVILWPFLISQKDRPMFYLITGNVIVFEAT